MDLQKLTVKFFTAAPDIVPLTDFIEIFHGWIQATDGVYHDIADYSHMQSGPGIVLIAQQANVHIDETGGRRGLLLLPEGTAHWNQSRKIAHGASRRAGELPALGARSSAVRKN